MRTLLPAIVCTAALCCTMCGRKAERAEETATTGSAAGPLTLDLRGPFEEKDLFLQDIADVRYVPLETNDESLLRSISSIAMRGNRIVVSDRLGGQIVVFDSCGRYFNKIDRKGTGPHEYFNIFASAVDFDNELVYIEDVYYYRAYDFDGYMIKKIPHTGENYASMMYLWDPQRLITYYETYGRKEKGDTILGNYFFIDTETGVRTPAGIEVEDPATNTRIVRDGAMSRARGIQIRNMLKTDGKVVISDYVLPHVYSYSPSGLSPIIERITDNDGPSGTRWLSSVAFAGDTYIMFRTAKITDEEDINKDNLLEEHNIIYNCRNQSFTEGGFRNRDIESKGSMAIDAWGDDLPRNTIVERYPAEFLHMLNEKGRLTGRLKELADTLADDANDVLVIATLR